jgi:hypothetical protein
MAQSLFGMVDPQSVQQAIQLEQQKNMMERANMDPAAYLRYSAGLQGQRIGQNVGRLFGTEQADPRLKQASDAQAAYQEALAASGGDASSPSFFKAFANAAAQRNLGPLAQQAAEQAAKLESEQAQTFQRTASGTASLATAAKEKLEAPLTIADRSRLTQLQNEFGEVEGANKFRAERDAAERQRAAAGVPQTPTEKALTPIVAKTRGDILNAALNSQKTLQTANAMDSLLNTAFTGVGSGGKLTLGQVASAFGVQVQGVTETEQLNSLLAALTQGQAKNLPGALSDKDVQFLKDAIGKGSYTVDTLRAVVKRIRTEALTAEIENAEIQAVTNAGGDLNKFDFVANRKKANTLAQQQLKEQEDKIKRLQQLRQKRGS